MTYTRSLLGHGEWLQNLYLVTFMSWCWWNARNISLALKENETKKPAKWRCWKSHSKVSEDYGRRSAVHVKRDMRKDEVWPEINDGTSYDGTFCTCLPKQDFGFRPGPHCQGGIQTMENCWQPPKLLSYCWVEHPLIHKQRTSGPTGEWRKVC